MARPDAAPTLQTQERQHIRPGFSQSEIELDDGGIVEFPDVTGGMVDGLPRSLIPQNTFKVLKNARVRDDWVGVREGTDEVGTKPDSNRVIGVINFIGEDLVRKVCRVTQSTFHVWTGEQWNAFSVSGGFKGTAKRVSAAQLFGKMYLGFDVSDGIWEVDFDSRTVTQVSEAPGGKFLATFAERIFAANLFRADGRFPSAYAACVNSDPQDWDGETSVFNDLIADELGNEITGVVALTRELILVRRQSIVHVSRQPFGLAPVRADTVIKGYGSDLPYTTVRALNGIIFADSRTSSVYYYTPGSVPQPLTSREGPHIHELLFEDLANAQFAQGAWEPFNDEYHLGLVWTTDNDVITRRWVCSFHHGTPVWTYDDSPTLSCIGTVLPPPDPTTIDELSGTINALSGSIDSLSSRAVPSPKLFAGTTTGEVIEFSYDHETEWDGAAMPECLIQSQNIGSISRRRVMKDLELKCSIPVDGSVTIEQSNDDSTWTNTKTEARTGATGFQSVRLPKTQKTGEDLWWRLKTTAPKFRLHSWWARIKEKGLQQGGQL